MITLSWEVGIHLSYFFIPFPFFSLFPHSYLLPSVVVIFTFKRILSVKVKLCAQIIWSTQVKLCSGSILLRERASWNAANSITKPMAFRFWIAKYLFHDFPLHCPTSGVLILIYSTHCASTIFSNENFAVVNKNFSIITLLGHFDISQRANYITFL